MGQILFRNCNLLDTAAGELRPGHCVLVENDPIVEAHVHAAITTLDLAAMEHRPRMRVAQEACRVLEGMLARGFTSVRDAEGADWGLTEALTRSLIREPRLSFAGRVLSPAEILRSATVVNAEILNRRGELGVVAPGALADLLVVNGNPREDLACLEGQGKHLDVVMKDGELVVNRLAA